MKYWLGAGAGRRVGAVRQLFCLGSQSDLTALSEELSSKYGGRAVLCKNGRSGLAIALEAYFQRGDAVIVNGFTCYAVVEAVKAAGLTPVYADISRENLNFGVADLEKVVNSKVKGIIVQNTLGNPVDIVAIEKFAKKHNLLIIEDLAHCVGVLYPDGREVGTVGVATALSFGKDKMIDATSGGAVVLRGELSPALGTRPAGPSPRAAGANARAAALRNPSSPAKVSPRERFYPLFMKIYRGLAHVHLNGVWMRGLLKLGWVERSADNRLDTTRSCTKWQAKLALEQLKGLKKSGEPVLREFYLVRDRDKCLQELRGAGYEFGGFWYERPVSPERYYGKAGFDEKKCPVATEVAKEIINFPTYYSKADLRRAREIVKKYELKESRNE